MSVLLLLFPGSYQLPSIFARRSRVMNQEAEEGRRQGGSHRDLFPCRSSLSPPTPRPTHPRPTLAGRRPWRWGSRCSQGSTRVHNSGGVEALTRNFVSLQDGAIPGIGIGLLPSTTPPSSPTPFQLLQPSLATFTPRPPYAVVYLAQLPLPSSVVGSCPPFSAAFAPNRLDVDALPSSSSSYLRHYPPLPAVSTPACCS